MVKKIEKKRKLVEMSQEEKRGIRGGEDGPVILPPYGGGGCGACIRLDDYNNSQWVIYYYWM